MFYLFLAAHKIEGAVNCPSPKRSWAWQSLPPGGKRPLLFWADTSLPMVLSWLAVSLIESETKSLMQMPTRGEQFWAQARIRMCCRDGGRRHRRYCGGGTRTARPCRMTAHAHEHTVEARRHGAREMRATHGAWNMAARPNPDDERGRSKKFKLRA